MKNKIHHSESLLMLALASFAMAGCEKDIEEPYGPSKNLIFHETFEGVEPFSDVHNFETGEWDYALQFVDSIVYDGNRTARFEIRAEQPLVADGKRSEVTIIMGTNENLTKQAWYSFAVYFPSSFSTDTTYDVISQWYNAGSAVRLFVNEDRFFVDIGTDPENKEKIELGDFARERWHEFVFSFYHSPYSDGHVTIWHNGRQKLSRSGGNLYNEGLPKWKIGIYKASFETGTSRVGARVVFIDNVKVGNEYASYRDMEPLRP